MFQDNGLPLTTALTIETESGYIYKKKKNECAFQKEIPEYLHMTFLWLATMRFLT